MINFQYFDDLWGDHTGSLEKHKQHWDIRAEEFNQYRNETGQKRMKSLLDYFVQNGISYEQQDVLDIGCGSGQFSIEFAKKANSVTGLDISPKMIQYAQENAKNENINNAEFFVLPWEHLDLSEKGWKKKFDLVAAIMTPAISSRQSLEKMMAASKGICFLSGHLEKYEVLKADIEQNVLRWEPDTVDYGKGIYCSFNILWLHGIYPEISYHTLERENIRTIEEAFTYYCAQLEMRKMLTSVQKTEIRAYLEEVAEDGQVKDTFRSKSGWLLWRNNK